VSGDWRLSVGASEEDTEELVRVWLVLSLNQAEWMHAGELAASFAEVGVSVGFMRPHGPCTLAKSEVGGSFTESIDLLGWKDHINLNEFSFEYESLSFSFNKRVLLVVSVREREWLSFNSQVI
jgi:hypothetical protein